MKENSENDNIQIKLNAADEVAEFVAAAERCDFDIDVFYNRVIVDAKSILGVLSLDLSHILTVRCAERDSKFEKALQKFCVA
ncbi:MAG: HPr family phosphocarrier protein [Hespellia sp.]|nr:HPr family phosphocarrier protein [Hespellia sp.]